MELKFSTSEAERIVVDFVRKLLGPGAEGKEITATGFSYSGITVYVEKPKGSDDAA